MELVHDELMMDLKEGCFQNSLLLHLIRKSEPWMGLGPLNQFSWEVQ